MLSKGVAKPVKGLSWNPKKMIITFFFLPELCKWIISRTEKKTVVKQLKIDRENWV